MNKKIIIIICLALVAFAANAQTISDELRRDKAGQGHVVLNQSAEIERLVNGVTVPQTTNTPSSQKEEQTTSNNQNTAPVVERSHEYGKTIEKTDAAASADKPAEKVTEKPAEKRNVSPATETVENETSSVNTNKKIMRHSYKATGYRIQAYSGGNKREDRAKCEQIGAKIKASFPDLPVYVHFYSPSWKCRVGNFTDMSEAQQYLKKIRAMGYSQACLVKGTINVQY